MRMDKKNSKEEIYDGIAASPGVSHGWVFVFESQEFDIPHYTLQEDAHDSEVARFEYALLETRRQINEIRMQVAERIGEEEARIFDAHLLVLEDVALIDETIRSQKDSGYNIETCFHEVSQRYIEAFRMMDDDYIKERLSDIEDVARRVLNVLTGYGASSLSQFEEDRIVIANDLSPSMTGTIDRNKLLGIATDAGSRTSHAVIMARSLQVPAVVGLHHLAKHISPDDYILVDGDSGRVIRNPTEETLRSYGKYKEERKSLIKLFDDSLEKESRTKDGEAITLRANIGGPEDLQQCWNTHVEGVGLYRTESLFLSRSYFPGEEEQYQAYSEVVKALYPNSVTIRTLDIGGDKQLENHYLHAKEENPFMGLRAVRFCLEHPEIFITQLKAILRASAHGSLKLMYPMISGVEELKEANQLLEQARSDLREEAIAFDENMKIGVMIEIPSAVLVADLLAQHCDFFSIGTNDLIQYTLCVDRSNDRIAHLYEPCHPSVIRSIQYVVKAAREADIETSVCGEMAGESVYIPLLLGLGIREFSISPMLVGEVKYLLSNISMEEIENRCKEWTGHAEPAPTFEALQHFKGRFMKPDNTPWVVS